MSRLLHRARLPFSITYWMKIDGYHHRLGEQAFFGPPLEALDHFRSIGYELTDHWVNPAEYVLNITTQKDEQHLQVPEIACRLCRCMPARSTDSKLLLIDA